MFPCQPLAGVGYAAPMARPPKLDLSAVDHWLAAHPGWTRDGNAVVFRCLCSGRPEMMSIPLGGGEPRPLAKIAGGSHVSFSPDFSLIMDVVGHKALWVSTLQSGKPEQVFAFDELHQEAAGDERPLSQ